MRRIATAEAAVDVPVAFAFTYVADLTTLSEWFPDVTVRAVGAPATPHRDYIERVKNPTGGQTQSSLHISEFVRDAKLIVDGTYWLLLPRSQMVFEPTGPAACQLRWQMDSRRDIPLVWRLALPIAKHVIGGRGRQAMATLKALLEARYRVQRTQAA